VTGDERAALERLGETAESCGLRAECHRYDLPALRAARGYPGEVAKRKDLFGLTVTVPGWDPAAPRFCVNGHVDVVNPGSRPWERDPWSGCIEDGRLHGRGSADMKGGLTAGLHALASIQAAGGARGDIVLEAVSSEEDGGLGAFAALERDEDFAGALIPEPTGLDVVCAQAGSLLFEGFVYGRSAHAAMRLEGVSAIDRYIPLHQAMRAYESEVNANVENELMRALTLPYPISVGQVEAGEWQGQVPDRLRFTGRLGVPIGACVQQARARFERVLTAAFDAVGPPVDLRWTGTFRPSATATGHALVTLAQRALADELRRPVGIAGVPWGADMQHFCARGIPCVMLGPSGIARAHAVDEYVELDELVVVARAIIRILLRFGEATV
jgi:acetylornithine deacetylase